MLDAWLIEELKRKEEGKQVQIPLYIDIEPPQEYPIHEESPEDKDRGVVIISF